MRHDTPVRRVPDGVSLQLGPLHRVGVSVVPDPLPTLLSVVGHAVLGRDHGVPAPWREMVRAAVPADAAEVLAPVLGAARIRIPAVLLDGIGTPGASAAEMPARLADTAGARAADELIALFAGSRRWPHLADRPQAWLHRYVAVMQASWTAFAPIWRSARPLAAREAERVGTGVVSDALGVVLTRLRPDWRLADATLHVPCPNEHRFDLGERRLSLVPLVSGDRATLVDFTLPDRVLLGYPLPGLGNLRAPDKPRTDPLTLLLGPARAAILRRTNRPTTMGELARAVGCRPGVATYHCDQLADAGLLHRERHGREIRVRRTDRGTALLDTLS